MKKRKRESFIDYRNESIDVTRECCKYLLNNNFYGNEEQKNIELLEEALILYSAKKIGNWNSRKASEIIELCFSDLPSVLEIMNNHIPIEQREEFFAQYTHCIIFLYSKIKSNEPIEWIKKQSNNIDFIITKDRNSDITKIITGLEISPYEISLQLLESIKTNHPQKRISF